MRRSERDNALSQRRITRRGLITGGVQVAVLGGLATRMHFLQVTEADQFRFLAEENRINIRLIAPARGEIFDRTGRVIARNVPSYRVTMTREDAGDPEAVIARLSQIIEMDPDAIETALEEMRKRRGDIPVTVADRITWEDLSRVAVNAPALPGVTPEVGLSRIYPLADDFTHVVGYVGPVSDYDLSKIEDPDPLLRLPRFQIGKVGIEARAEESLRGKAGVKRVEVNAAGREMRELDRREGHAGVDIQLTLDHMLQNYVQARLGEESAAAVVIDCDSGDLLAVASAPAFDPNLFVNGISTTDYNALLENDHRPLVAKSVQGLYPPGSTFKMVSALAALENDIITTEDTFRCKGVLEVHSSKFHCWKRAGHGNVDLNRSLRESCDVYYYELALKTGIENISAMARKLGVGLGFDIPMSGVKAGVAPTKAWKLRTKGKEWVVGDSVNAAIGQGFVLASPLELAVMSARIATGRSVTPRLVKSIDGVEQPTGHGASLGINENHLRVVRKAMFDVSNHTRGTGYGSRIVAPEMRMAGKTGTSQVRRITEAERRAGVTRNEDLPWERRDHALYVDFAPFDNPKYAVAVVVEHGGGGSKAAAPIARDITLQALYGEDPPLSAYPAKDHGRIRAQQKRLRELRPPPPKDRPTRA
ncbi:penicillin-binding protein 2 [Alisedimentitalea sp. MJ-SS2]|uniref:penicillin-binding protein 2 n=1 Tax=Aliisedimentitalea sp. MJ-SS2 TaxID=3049795 RepID=UPI00290F40FC|nr:penicillin-binding protein 2 [Alisedimentitalea sp. MJ-SS2]MDU8928849.1 penicillin-binding protein 2 [Alisedimentitalea sp. MJ-SS2]